MKTDDLIQALSADGGSRTMTLGRTWWIAMLVAVILAAVVFLAMLGPRPDIASAAETLRFLFKFVFTLILAGAALAVVRGVSRPEGSSLAALLTLAPLLLLCAMGWEMLSTPSGEWQTRLVGTNSLLCLTFIPLIGLAPLAVFLAALRHGAPHRPEIGGAVAGILAGAVAATFYAAHCVDDSPLFVAAWYLPAIAFLALLGSVGGKVLARW